MWGTPRSIPLATERALHTGGLPYAAWVSFATLLNLSLAILN